MSLNPETIKLQIYNHVVRKVTDDMFDYLQSVPDTDKPVTDTQWAEFIVNIMSMAIDRTVDATLGQLVLRGDYVISVDENGETNLIY